MASEEEQKKDEVAKGFAGLSSMVSDVETTVTRAAKEKPESKPEQPSSERAGPAAQHPAENEPEPHRQSYQAPAQPSGGSSTGKWLLGIGAVIGVIWLASESGNKSTPSAPTYYPSAQPPVSTAPAPSWQPPQAPAQPQTPSRPSEDKPPVGSNNVLNTAQIRYCLAEDIRLGAAKSVVNNYSDSDVDRFNAMVADYNSRCGEFRYRRGILESARSDVERYRAVLQAEGRSRFVRSPSVGARSAPAEISRPQPDATVQAIQRRLNELGYDAGVADGLAGAKTRAAISAFQRDQNVLADGIASSSLLARLNAVVPGPAAPPDQLLTGASPALADSSVQSRVPKAIEPSRDREDFRTCISGEYPSLCKHSLLTSDEAIQVAAAEKGANFRTCISGEYPSLCRHSLLTREEAVQVEAAERRANFRTCISGEYPSLCKHSLLTREEAVQVNAAERRANFRTCISGEYPSLCKHSLLTPEEAARVAEAERRARSR